MASYDIRYDQDQYYFDLESPFRDLPESAQQMLGDRMMPDSEWKRVADRVGFSAISIEVLAAMHTARAAHQMLREWGRRNGSTLRVLSQTLSDIERRDIITLLDDIRKRKSTSN